MLSAATKLSYIAEKAIFCCLAGVNVKGVGENNSKTYNRTHMEQKYFW